MIGKVGKVQNYKTAARNCYKIAKSCQYLDFEGQGGKEKKALARFRRKY